MTAKLFSERHDKALRDKRLRLALRLDLRRSIYRLMDRYSTWGGWDNVDNLTCDAVVQSFLDRRGWKSMQWWDGKQMQPAASFEEFLEKGVPSHILDAIELFREQLDHKKTLPFTSELNNIFEIHHSPIRFFRGEFYVIDSAFLESQVLAQTQQLLEANSFQGALDEFLEARSAYMEKDFKRTVLMANHAFESTLKAVLELDRKRSTAELIKKACRGGLVPTYYEGFLDHFQEFMTILTVTRTNEAGHGQGKEVTAVPPPLAEFALHLSGALIVFLIKRHLERTPPEEPEFPEDDIPF